MPKVPTYDEAQVQAGRLPSAYQSPRLPEGSLGEVEARALRSLGQSLEGLGDIVVRREKEKDANLVMRTLAEADDEIRPFLYDKQNGEKFRFGADAIGGSDRAKMFLDGLKDKYGKKLTSRRQREAFDSLFSKTRESVLDRMAVHEGEQFRVYQDETTASIISGAERDVAAEPGNQAVIDNALLRVQTATLANHYQHGDSGEKLLAAESRIHVSAVMNLAGKDAAAAAEYYKANKEKIDPKLWGKIEDSLSADSLRQTAQRLSDSITDQGGSIEDQLKRARSITKGTTFEGVDSAKLRDEVETRLKTQYAFEERVRKDRKEEVENDAWKKIDNILDNKGDVNAALKIADGMADAGTSHKMKKYITDMLTSNVKTDFEVYDRLNRMMAEDEDGFKELNLSDYKGQISPSTLRRFSDKQAKMRGGEAIGGEVRTARQRVDETLRSIGLNPTPKAGSAMAPKVARFRALVDEEIEKIEAKPKTKEWFAAVDSIISRLTIQGEIRGSGIFDDYDARLYEVLGTPEAGKFYVDDTIRDLSPDTRSTFEGQLKSLKVRALESERGAPLTQAEKDEIMAAEVPDKLLAEFINKVATR